MTAMEVGLLPGWKLWWLSYAGEEASRGVVVVAGKDFLHACGRSKTLGLSPGGEVKGFEVPRGEWFDRCLLLLNRRLSRQQLEELDLAGPQQEGSK